MFNLSLILLIEGVIILNVAWLFVWYWFVVYLERWFTNL